VAKLVVPDVEDIVVVPLVDTVDAVLYSVVV
jgi:hypothetical protein